jgi:hypothetical protein
MLDHACQYVGDLSRLRAERALKALRAMFGNVAFIPANSVIWLASPGHFNKFL